MQENLKSFLFLLYSLYYVKACNELRKAHPQRLQSRPYSYDAGLNTKHSRDFSGKTEAGQGLFGTTACSDCQALTSWLSIRRCASIQIKSLTSQQFPDGNN